jgi:hypothetical protein
LCTQWGFRSLLLLLNKFPYNFKIVINTWLPEAGYFIKCTKPLKAMRTITKTELLIRLLFLVCVISGALVSSIFASDEAEINPSEQQEVITLHNSVQN